MGLVAVLSMSVVLCPSGSAYSFIHRVMGEGCLLEDTLITILKIGLNHELPLSPSDALDIADRLVARAASFHNDGKIIDIFMHVCQ